MASGAEDKMDVEEEKEKESPFPTMMAESAPRTQTEKREPRTDHGDQQPFMNQRHNSTPSTAMQHYQHEREGNTDDGPGAYAVPGPDVEGVQQPSIVSSLSDPSEVDQSYIMAGDARVVSHDDGTELFHQNQDLQQENQHLRQMLEAQEGDVAVVAEMQDPDDQGVLADQENEVKDETYVNQGRTWIRSHPRIVCFLVALIVIGAVVGVAVGVTTSSKPPSPPTVVDTREPSPAPSPSNAPSSEALIVVNTPTPSLKPSTSTIQPSQTPSGNDTNPPSLRPTRAPSSFPTPAPTNPPSLRPTRAPSSFPTPAPTAFWQPRGESMVGEGNGNAFGQNIAMSSNGNVVAIGDHLNDNTDGGRDSGRVQVFEYDRDSWNPRGGDINGEDQGDNLGFSVALSNDGNILAVGSWKSSRGFTNSGHVQVYQFDGSNWGTLGQEINGIKDSDLFGISVSLSGDGSTLAACNDGGESGSRAHVFRLRNSQWVPLGDAINHIETGNSSPRSVDLSENGNILAFGADRNRRNLPANSGQVRVFQYDGATWNPLGQFINGDDEGDQSGVSVSISGIGSRLAIGAQGSDGGGSVSGQVRIFDLVGARWELNEKIHGPPGYELGWSVSLSKDGSVLASGAWKANVVYVYRLDAGGWRREGGTISVAIGRFGYDVALSSDGSVVAGGASGYVKVFSRA